MRSDVVKKGVTKAPHRSLFKASGLTDEEIRKPLIGVVTSQNDIIPGHINLDKIVEFKPSKISLKCKPKM